MSIIERIQNDLKDSMRARTKSKTDALRLITAAIKQIEVDERIVVDDARMLALLDKLCKQRNESISQFKVANRLDLVEQEQFELDIISSYLPEPLSEQEIELSVIQAIQDTAAEKISDMGKVMALLKPQMQGRADMAKVSQLIKAKLG